MANKTIDLYRADSTPQAYLSKVTALATFVAGSGLPAGGTSYSWGTVSAYTSGTSPLVLKKLAQTNEGSNGGAVVQPKEFQALLKNSLANNLAARQKFSRGY